MPPMPAARLGDMHVCPLVNVLVPHVGGPIVSGCFTVLIGGLPAARVTDLCVCVGPPDLIVMGEFTVLIGGLPAARMLDMTAHGGMVMLGCFTVLIPGFGGGGGTGGTAGTAAPSPPKTATPSIPKGCEYLNKPYTVEAPQPNFDNIRSASKLGPATAGKHTFPGDTAPSDATIREVEVKGRKIQLILPKSGAPAGKNLPTADQLAKSLGAVPGPQLDSIKQVVVSPNQNPSDSYWEKEYKIPGFSSAATGGSGGVTFYPKKAAWDQAFVDSTTIHEGGHTYSGDLWKDNSKQTAWEAAIKSDGRSPSTYADSSSSEDFSESLVMYSLSKGTKCEEAAKALYPARYKALDGLFGK